jgi:hypothetical protein
MSLMAMRKASLVSKRTTGDETTSVQALMKHPCSSFSGGMQFFRLYDRMSP